MVKQQKKKNIFEKIAELDAKQEAEIVKYNKVSTKKSRKSNKKMQKTTSALLVVFILGMPFLGWLLGVLLNPSGWMSDNPGVPFFVIYLAVTQLWFISVPIAIVIVALLISKKRDVAVVILFLMSIVASLYILSATTTAAENEFTG